MDSIVGINWPRRSTKSIWVSFLDVDILFSYSTPIAVRGHLDGKWVNARDATKYSRATGCHHVDEGTTNWHELQTDEFRRLMNRALLQQLVKSDDMIKEVVNERVARVLETM